MIDILHVHHFWKINEKSLGFGSHQIARNMLLLLDPSELNVCYRRADTELGEATLTPDEKTGNGKLPCQAATKTEVPQKILKIQWVQ